MQTTTQDAAQYFGHEVIDSAGNKVGTVEHVWVDDATEELEFIGVKTGWLMGKTHVIPVATAGFQDQAITIPFEQEQVKNAPSFSGDEELSAEQEDEIYRHYGVARSTSASPSGLPGGERGASDSAPSGEQGSGRSLDRGAAATEDGQQAGMTLSEEHLQVGKRQVDEGSVRLRKIVRSEHQEVPVELSRETVSVERIDASEATVPGDAFQETEIEVPVRREEAVVGKEARVTGGVNLTKNVETESRTVGGDVRKEDVEVDKNVGAETTRDRTSDRGY